jgi:NADH:ubiquinone reductase (H+-translocating)
MNAIQESPRSGDAASIDVDAGEKRKRVVIAGGGFAGAAAVHALRHADADVLLIDRRNHHIFQPLLYQVATATLSPSDIATPLRQLEAKQRNLTVLLGEVTGVNLQDHSIDATLSGGNASKIQFDFLVVATGASSSYFGHDDFAANAPALKTLTDAQQIRGKILSAFETAEATSDAEERARQMTFVLVGGGPTGVELAASLARMAKKTLQGNFRSIDPAKVRIILIDGAKRILPTFGESISQRVTQRLEKLGVEVLADSPVEAVDASGVVTKGNKIPSAMVLWTAGVAASPLAKALGGETDRAGRAMVDPFLKLAGEPSVFIAGDAATVNQDGHPVPGVAQVAIQEGRYVGRLIASALKGKEPAKPFRYFDKGNMAVVGKNFAVLERGGLRTSGFLTWIVWAFVHILTLPQMHNRLRVQREWLWSYFTGARGSRLIDEAPRH